MLELLDPATREFNQVLPVYIAITDQNCRVLTKKC